MTLRGLSEIRGWFYRDPTPTWYICQTPYGLLGMDEWVRGFRWVTYADCFDGAHPRVFVPPQHEPSSFQFETLEDMNAYLLGRPDVQAHLRSKGPGRALFLFYDERAESLAHDLDLHVWLPPAPLRRAVDSKTETTRIADRAGVPCVPNAMGVVRSWEDLKALARPLGEHWVVQTPYGDSGTTTFFISSQADFDRYSKQIVSEPEVKVMRRIRPMQAAIEACVTRQGTIVGPLMTEVVGFPELTPYRGGWAGNEVSPEAFSAQQLRDASARTVRFGEELRKLGYRGYFEIDWLIDQDDGSLYLGEVNPRFTGASSMTNLAAFAHADVPLALLHLLEFSGTDFELDVETLNRRWAEPDNQDSWGQLIIKYTDPEEAWISEAPRAGVWRMTEEGLRYRHMQTHRRTVEDENDGFFLRIAKAGEKIAAGYDLGILVLRGRLLTPEGDLTPRSRKWIAAVRGQYRTRPV
jgi:hypothetical protein